jgi:hypothetical protein
MRLKVYLKDRVTWNQYRLLRKIYTSFASLGHGHDIGKLAGIYKTDKGGDHYYTDHYETHFRKFRFKRVNLLEIGVGGYDDPKLGGASLRMWKRYFPFGRIFAFDLHDKSIHEERRIKILQGDQYESEFMTKLISLLPELDMIIDDGSHINAHVIFSFEKLFPRLKDGGIYVVEDTQTSYWKEFGGDEAEDGSGQMTTMKYFKNLCDGINYREFRNRNYSPTYLDLNIKSIHFYHNLIFIYKGRNND